MKKKKEVSIDDLAVLVQQGFEEVNGKIDDLSVSVDKRFEQVDKRFEQVDNRFGNVEAHLAMLSRDVGEIRHNFVYRHEFDDVLARVALIERNLKIKSGKENV